MNMYNNQLATFFQFEGFMIWIVFIDAGLNQCQLIWIGGSIMFCCVIYIVEIPTTLLIKWTGTATRAINDLVYDTTRRFCQSERCQQNVQVPAIHLWTGASISDQNIHFDKLIKPYSFIQTCGEACIYKKVSGSTTAFQISICE